MEWYALHGEVFLETWRLTKKCHTLRWPHTCLTNTLLCQSLPEVSSSCSERLAAEVHLWQEEHEMAKLYKPNSYTVPSLFQDFEILSKIVVLIIFVKNFWAQHIKIDQLFDFKKTFLSRLYKIALLFAIL